MMKGNGEEGRWGRWEVVRKGSSEEGEEAGARNRAFFRVHKVAAGDDESYLVCATGAAGVGWSFFFAAV